MTNIEWTEKTWNPIAGCMNLSTGCRNCYAVREAWRLAHNPKQSVADKYRPTVQKRGDRLAWTGTVTFSETALLEPLKRKVPTEYFVNSMSDLFYEQVPREWVDRTFAVMWLAHWHTFQVLTKRSDRQRLYLSDPATVTRVAAAACEIATEYLGQDLKPRELPRDLVGRAWLPRNIHGGVSVEHQDFDFRIIELLQTPYVVRFLSCEPLLGRLDLSGVSIRGEMWWVHALKGIKENPYGAIVERAPIGRIHQVIVGGETGPRARPTHKAWVRSLLDQCAQAGTAFFFKQWGEWAPCDDEWLDAVTNNFPKLTHGAWHQTARGPQFKIGCVCNECEPGGRMVRVGRADAGRVLDGREWNERPDVRADA